MVLITALVFLVILTLLGVTSLSTNTLDERMASNSQDVNRAFQAAESGINIAFNSGNVFTGTVEDFQSVTVSENLGDYGASTSYNSEFLGSYPTEGYEDITVANQDELLKWYHYGVESTGSTSSGTSSVIGAGAKLLRP